LTSRIQQFSLGDRMAERVGRHRVWAGILLIVAGLVGGFTAMFRDADSLAVNLLVPVSLGVRGAVDGHPGVAALRQS
jgi:hypothetical protein